VLVSAPVRLTLTSVLLSATVLLSAPAAAQAPVEQDDADEVSTEEIDATRLDVERLPPEAIRITRDLYAHGFFIEAQVGARGFINGVGDFADPGPWVSIGVGFEIVDFLHIVISSEMSFHNTSAPTPPAQTAFEVLGGTAAVRLQGNFSELFAMWFAAQFTVLAATTDILDLYGLTSASSVGISYGGEVGADFHFRARHHSMGFFGGVRHYPSFEGMNGSSPSLGIHGAAYLRYVF
jgi:hypothetical protein